MWKIIRSIDIFNVEFVLKSVDKNVDNVEECIDTISG